jgi:hypothetical protein
VLHESLFTIPHSGITPTPIGAPLACILQCDPIAKYWDPSILGQCVHPGAYVVSTSSIVLVTDVLVLIMPSWVLHDLKMPLGRKIMVIAFLSFGIGLTIVSAVRTNVPVKVFIVKEEEMGSYVQHIVCTVEYQVCSRYPRHVRADDHTISERVYSRTRMRGWTSLRFEKCERVTEGEATWGSRCTAYRSVRCGAFMVSRWLIEGRYRAG